ncbi:hypothetical protein BZG36_05438 [Bifiguratus adelaidae]|uniref:Uncharacterized protein n=1 Tax=Bifiguratus adelaidae TaxID=1938954 RepID=A0A261XTF5_9FUNG|nr:hypothetical protein BZG36_05438 [Bifiguratus adelaidae]
MSLTVTSKEMDLSVQLLTFNSVLANLRERFRALSCGRTCLPELFDPSAYCIAKRLTFYRWLYSLPFPDPPGLVRIAARQISQSFEDGLITEQEKSIFFQGLVDRFMYQTKSRFLEEANDMSFEESAPANNYNGATVNRYEPELVGSTETLELKRSFDSN